MCLSERNVQKTKGMILVLRATTNIIMVLFAILTSLAVTICKHQSLEIWSAFYSSFHILFVGIKGEDFLSCTYDVLSIIII